MVFGMFVCLIPAESPGGPLVSGRVARGGYLSGPHTEVSWARSSGDASPIFMGGERKENVNTTVVITAQDPPWRSLSRAEVDVTAYKHSSFLKKI